MPPISFDKAVASLMNQVSQTNRKGKMAIEDAAGYALCDPVIANEPNPRFDNSAVVGYAVGNSVDAKVGASLKVQGISAAGGLDHEAISPGTARRIFTGAELPADTYGIIMQEDVQLQNGMIVLGREIRRGDHVRLKGTDFAEGDLLLPPGTVIDPGVTALLAFVGNVQCQVWESPNVSVITTGDELVDPADVPVGSQIRDTNGSMLTSLSRRAVTCQPKAIRVQDSESAMIEILKSEADSNDAIIVAGGASVGDRDFLRPAMEALGTIYFHGVAIRPGKPFLFGKIGDCFVFGLPGNPASAFVCFEIFVKDALRKLAGWNTPTTIWVDVPTGFDHKAIGREDFVRVVYRNGKVYPCSEPGSFGLVSVAVADG